ncbi:hypothetical protein LOTGIDRAFT_166441 [Lottia gigantea]|uniref:Uncharacterized protein n=1 Tax=Lottia gigantea TaxID=225164 RepID=V4A2N3_LOTGI|nr:hypothetical protein LOTGIDRAFT_166441 [Lottia gigantea]ESO87561.1 hypothetical protein LOTGIDRAFT_166441 [Lottia gigantea]
MEHYSRMFDKSIGTGNQNEFNVSICETGTERKSYLRVKLANLRKRHRQKKYVEQIAQQFRIDEFKTFFRVDRKTVACLQDSIVMICTERNRNNKPAIIRWYTEKSIHERILILLWYMARGDKYASIADRARALVVSFIHQFLLDKVVVWPTEQMTEMQGMYMELKSFPCVISSLGLDFLIVNLQVVIQQVAVYYKSKSKSCKECFNKSG